MFRNQLFRQGLRFGVVGLISNLLLFLFYLGLTTAGLDYKIAMSLLYLVGILQTFVFNKKWTFNRQAHPSTAFVRYFGLYVVGYLVNLLALFTLVDQIGWPHQWVQGVMIPIMALLLFLVQKYWVFSKLKVTPAQSDFSS